MHTKSCERAIHERIMASIEGQIVEALRGEKLDDWAECLSGGDYSSMAI